MLKLIARLRTNEKGQSLVEFTLGILILLPVTFGMIEFSRAVYTASVIRAAAQEGARAAIVAGATTTDVTNAVLARVVGLPNPGTINVQVATVGGAQQVTVTYQFSMVTFLTTQSLNVLSQSSTINLSSTASMIAQPSLSSP